MIIKPSIRSNFFTNSHPLGCRQNVLNQINEVKSLPSFDGPKNVLIIGGSSGYGLASRIALAYASSANKFSKETNQIHKDFIGDAFSPEMKENVIKFVKEKFGKLDLIVYSLASGGRLNYQTNELVRSHIKTIGEDAVGKTIDIINMKIDELTVTTANEQEIKDTVFVMGGSDWYDWITALDEADVLNVGVKTISYTYIGGPTTEKIYRGGTLGKAKEDLENHAQILTDILYHKYGGEALISSSKAVTTKASVFIPQMTIYVSCLYDVMSRHHVHESILLHKYRLYKDMVYGAKRIIDHKKRIRLDHLEMDPSIQEETIHMMTTLNNDELLQLNGTKMFLKDFYQINGFEFDEIDYNQDIDIEKLSKLKPE